MCGNSTSATTVEHVRENGYGYIHDAAPPEFVERLRETIVRIIGEGAGGNGLEGRGANMLLPKDPIFWLEGKPYEMRVMLGREDFLNTPEGGFAHGIKLPRAMDWAKT